MFHDNIEKSTLNNSNFRQVIFTSPKRDFQLVLMSLKPNEDIGIETHENITQFFRFESGSGKAIVNGKEQEFNAGDVVVVPKGCEHNIIAGSEGLKLYTIYIPANHPDGKIQVNKEIEGGVNYYEKYLMYKRKYLMLKKQI